MRKSGDELAGGSTRENERRRAWKSSKKWGRLWKSEERIARGGRKSEETGPWRDQKCNRIGGGMFGKIRQVKFRSGCMMNNSVRRTGFLLVFFIGSMVIGQRCDEHDILYSGL